MEFNIVPILLDIGNIIFFIATFPQLKITYTNRNNLKDLSAITFLLISIGCFCFMIGNYLIGAKIAGLLNVFNIIYNSLTIYWIKTSGD